MSERRKQFWVFYASKLPKLSKVALKVQKYLFFLFIAHNLKIGFQQSSLDLVLGTSFFENFKRCRSKSKSSQYSQFGATFTSPRCTRVRKSYQTIRLISQYLNCLDLPSKQKQKVSSKNTDI